MNGVVSDEIVSYTHRDGSKGDYKQMHEFRSSLRRLLYFFPMEPDTTPDTTYESSDDTTDDTETAVKKRRLTEVMDMTRP